MMSKSSTPLPRWFAYMDLACVALAGGLWYAFPQAGAWPLALAVVPWGARYFLAGWFTRRSLFDLPLVLFVFTAGLGVWAAYDRGVAWPKFWLIVGSVFLFYGLVNAEPLGDVRLWLLAFFGAGVALYFLVTHDWDEYPAKIEALTRLGRALQQPLPAVPGHRLHPNVAGGLMAMLLPFAGWATIQGWRQVRHGSRALALAGGLGALALTSFGLLMTTSRGAWVALGAALVLAGLWLFSGLWARGHANRRAWLFPLLLLAVMVAVLAAGVAWPGGITAAIDLVPGPNTGLDRVELLRRTLILVRDYPLVGAGLGGFQMLYSTYVLLLHVGFTVHSHNLFLNVAIEQGLGALLALVWMWLLFVVAVWRGLSRSDSRGMGALGVAALSLVVLLVHGLVDDVLYGSRAVLLLFVPLAFAVPVLREQGAHLRRWLAMALPVAILLLMVLALIWQGKVLSRVTSNLAAVRQSQAELGVYSWPEWPIQDAVRRAVDLSRPVAQFERALALDPGNVAANRRLGQIELSLGEYEGALVHLAKAYAGQPGDETTRQLYGEALIVNGRQEEGQALWATVSHAQNQLQIRAFWYQHIGDAERAAWVQQAATAASSE